MVAVGLMRYKVDLRNRNKGNFNAPLVYYFEPRNLLEGRLAF